MDFAHAFQTDFSFLQGAHEINELVGRCIQLADDVLNGHQHTQRHLASDHISRRKKDDQQVFALIDENGARPLQLVNAQCLQADAEQLRLGAFPRPAFLLFRIVHLDFLHPVDQLKQVGLVFGSARKALVFQFPAFCLKIKHPGKIDGGSGNENRKNGGVPGKEY